MFKIYFTPQRGSSLLHLEKRGTTLRINGKSFDLSCLAADGDVLQTLDCELAVGPVVRVGNDILIKLVWPYGTTRTEIDSEGGEQTYTIEMPESVELISDGVATFPGCSLDTPQQVVGTVDLNMVSTAADRLAARRATVWEKVKVLREARRKSGVLVGSHWFHSDDTSRIQQLGLVLLGSNIPPGATWKTVDNVDVPLTQTLATQIFMAEAASDNAHFEAAKALRTLINASNNLESVDIESGWPTSYAEAQ